MCSGVGAVGSKERNNIIFKGWSGTVQMWFFNRFYVSLCIDAKFFVIMFRSFFASLEFSPLIGFPYFVGLIFVFWMHCILNESTVHYHEKEK